MIKETTFGATVINTPALTSLYHEHFHFSALCIMDCCLYSTIPNQATHLILPEVWPLLRVKAQQLWLTSPITTSGKWLQAHGLQVGTAWIGELSLSEILMTTTKVCSVLFQSWMHIHYPGATPLVAPGASTRGGTQLDVPFGAATISVTGAVMTALASTTATAGTIIHTTAITITTTSTSGEATSPGIIIVETEDEAPSTNDANNDSRVISFPGEACGPNLDPLILGTPQVELVPHFTP